VVELADNSTATNSANTNSPVATAAVTNSAAANLAATQPVSISVSFADIGLTGPCKVRDLWTHKDLGPVTGEFAPVINSHGAGLYRVSPAR
jgi:hypothetical protein